MMNRFIDTRSVTQGTIIKKREGEESRYDFQYINKRGYKTTMEGLSDSLILN